MKYRDISNSLFVKNRAKFEKEMKPGSIALFVSNDILPTNADGNMPFRQNSDLFYLSGVDQEETVLVLFPDAPRPDHREMLFVKETNEEIAIWEGQKLTKESATAVSGIASVFWLSEFERTVNPLIFQAENIYLNTNEHLRKSINVATRQDRYVEWCKEHFPLHNYMRSAPILHQLRSIKEPEEIELIRDACDITEKAFRRILNFVKPGVAEYEIEAELWHELIRNGSRKPAYEPIIASGYNACVLHYIENSRKCKDGDVLLLDIGAEYANYAADLSRSIPVNGHYSDRQKDVYNAVLRVQKAAADLLRPGKYLDEYHLEVGALMEQELVGLGLLQLDEIKAKPASNQANETPAYKKFFPHGTSHFLGLDVHDVGHWHEPIAAGMVFTVEPGIYIREESLGIRIENDILITEDGYEDLMASIPIEAGDIEEIMNT